MFEVIVTLYLLGCLAGLVGLAHSLIRTPSELQARPWLRLVLSALMIPITGVLAGVVAMFYWARFLRH